MMSSRLFIGAAALSAALVSMQGCKSKEIKDYKTAEKDQETCWHDDEKKCKDNKDCVWDPKDTYHANKTTNCTLACGWVSDESTCGNLKNCFWDKNLTASDSNSSYAPQAKNGACWSCTEQNSTNLTACPSANPSANSSFKI